MLVKNCNICKEVKDQLLFPKRGAVCKQCLSKRYSIWRSNNKEKLEKYFDGWYENNRENRKQKCIEYYINNKEKLNIRSKEYYKENKDIILEQNRKYRKSHKKELNEYSKEYNKQKRKVNIDFKLKAILRCRLNHLIRGNLKSAKTLKLLGCSLESLKKHLQETAIRNKYLDFNINTYSGKEYHIDHIVPCSAFNLKCSFHQKLCFNWSNLQILSALENDQKGDRLC